jgi:glycosyltransferase involved in cell wall biosynthesis
MKYLVAQDWINTHGNHAGMVHMCELLVEKYPNEYVLVYKPVEYPKNSKEHCATVFISRVLKKILRTFFPSIWIKRNVYYKPMLDGLKNGDAVFLLQYCSGTASQDILARYVKSHYNDVKIYAMSHLTKSKYLELGYDAKVIRRWDSFVDKHILMGTSLAQYFIECGIPENKISIGFHYVDNEYYNKTEEDIKYKGKPTIIAIGAMQRDFELLAKIVNNSEMVNWIICRGQKKVDYLFQGNNVKLVGYVPENKLRELMDESDASLNVMEDTVGSNVITTSLAMGLVVIVSDVGSIRDYVDETCAIFCQNTVESFTKAISQFASMQSRIVEMRRSALLKVSNLTIEKVHAWFCSLN